MRKSMSTVMSTALAATTLAGLGVLGTASSALAYSCSSQAYQTGGSFTSTGVLDGTNIRSGPSTNCTSIVGVGYLSHSVRVDCYVYSQSTGYFWDHVRDNTTGKSGWTREDVMDKVSYSACSPVYV